MAVGGIVKSVMAVITREIVSIAVFVQKKYRMANKKKELKRLPLLNIRKFVEKKKSDVIFILGSSAAINDLSDEEWGVVGAHDSMALNNFCFHHFVPDYYWLELSDNIPAMHYTFSEIAAKYAEKEPSFIMNYDNLRDSCVKIDRLPKEITKTMCLVQPRFRRSGGKKEIEKNLHKLKKEIEKKKVDAFSFQHVRGSLFACCQIAWALGYKKIILLGVSLDNQKYFYESIESENAEKMKNMILMQDAYEGRIDDDSKKHRTAREDTGTQAPSIIELIGLLNERFLLPSGVGLYVQNKESLLAKHLPVLDWENMID